VDLKTFMTVAQENEKVIHPVKAVTKRRVAVGNVRILAESKSTNQATLSHKISFDF
jgi:hypothetical protein